MQIILLHPRFTKARSITLGTKHILLLLLLMLTMVAGSSMGITYFLLNRAGNPDASPMLHKLAVSMSQEEDGRNEKYLKENLAMMAVKVGEMQAQMMRLDALGERVQGLAGIRPEEFNFKEAPGRGGAEVSSQAGPARDVSMDELRRMLDSLAVDAGHRADYLNAVEST
ncbi:hypothetical protein [Herbaspirillum sp. B65]|nr:hypothetical protein [Herbaspirillum sp. B65]